jgi:hypothetical protein
MYRYDRNNHPDGFYIYAYIRNKDSITAKAGTPYYIGKGKGGRAWGKHTGSANIPKNYTYIVILKSGLTELGAFALERRYIRWFGRKDVIYFDKPPGILNNQTDGGNGVSGRPAPNKGKKPSEETRKKWSKQRIGRKHSDETRAKLSIAHRNISDETRKKISDAGMGRVVSQETRDKNSASQKGRKKSEEQKEKQRIAMSGRVNGPMSEERKKKIGAANSNASEETKAKLRKSRLGKVMSEETKKKIGDANRAKNLIKKEKLLQPSVEQML